MVEKKPVIEALGCMKGKIRMAEDFDAPLPEELLTAFGYDTEKNYNRAAVHYAVNRPFSN